jgi:anti-sigma-K factor RskA
MTGPHEPHEAMTPAERDDAMAAEHALRLLEGVEHAEAERRMQDDPHFAAEVERWQTRLGGWTDDIAPVEPPAHVWSRIEAALGAPPAGLKPANRSILDSLWLWRAATAGALAAAAALAVVVMAPRPEPAPVVATPTEPAIRRAAVLNGENGQPAFVAVVEPERVLVTALSPYPLDADRALELWLVPTDGVPRSLGLIRSAQSTSIVMPEPLRPHAGTATALAVSLEPPGGAPGGQATGPLVAQGALSVS